MYLKLYLPESSDEDPKLLWWRLKSAHGSSSIPILEALGGGLEYPSSSTSGVGDTDFWTSSLSEHIDIISLEVVCSVSSSLIPDETFLPFFSFLRPRLIPRIPYQMNKPNIHYLAMIFFSRFAKSNWNTNIIFPYLSYLTSQKCSSCFLQCLRSAPAHDLCLFRLPGMEM